MGNAITAQELSDLQDQGASVKREPREILAPGLEDALAALSKSIGEKSNEAVVSAITSLTKAVQQSQSKPISLEPVVAALKEHTHALQNPPAYTLTIGRDSRGRPSNLTLIPKK